MNLSMKKMKLLMLLTKSPEFYRVMKVQNKMIFSVLYRTNAQSRVIEEIFLRQGIPYKIIGGIKFYDRKEIKDVIVYLKLLNNPHDTISLLRIINTPSRKIGVASLNHVQNFATRYNLSLFFQQWKKYMKSQNFRLQNKMTLKIC